MPLTVLDHADVERGRDDKLRSRVHGPAALGEVQNGPGADREVIPDVGDKLTDELFYSDHVEVGKDTSVCLYDAEIKVEFMPYEVGPYALGAPQAAFPKADVRALFEKSEVMDGVFAE